MFLVCAFGAAAGVAAGISFAATIFAIDKINHWFLIHGRKRRTKKWHSL